MKRSLQWLVMGVWFAVVLLLAIEYVTERFEPRDASRVTMMETP